MDDIKDRTDEAIQITYMNHRGKIAERRIIPIKLWFGKTEWYPERQWLMKAWDRDKEAERDFAVKRIVCPKVDDHNEQAKRIAELEDAGRILAFLDAIETTEFITADGGNRDVDPDGFGFSGEMLKLIRAIAEDENDVWNTAARCALAGPEPRNPRAVHWREAFDMAIGCIEFAATNKNDGPEFLDALRKYADLMIQELEPAADTKEPT